MHVEALLLLLVSLYHWSSTRMPAALPKEVNPHPSSVDLVGVEELVTRAGSMKLVKFLQVE